VIAFLLLSLPIFAVVALGWVATRAGWIASATNDALGAFAFYFALPALVFRLIASLPLDRSLNATFCGGYLASGALVFGLVLVVSILLNRQSVAAAGAQATTATVSNLGFLGPPLMLAFFGEGGAGPLAMAILAEVMVLFSVGGVIMSLASGAGSGVGIGKLVLRGTVLHPVVAAIVLGAAFAAIGIALPAPVDRFFAFFGASAGPTALFALGGALAAQHVDRSTVFAASGMATAKLIVYPLVAWFMLARLLDLDSFWVHAGVLTASLPPAGSNYVMAQRYAADADRVSAAIVLSTVASVFTVPLAAWLMLG
jgi:hypothetical protein